jgi:hypothetical protein
MKRPKWPMQNLRALNTDTPCSVRITTQKGKGQADTTAPFLLIEPVATLRHDVRFRRARRAGRQAVVV